MNCPRFDEKLRNASCRAVSGSIPRRTIRAGDGRRGLGRGKDMESV